VFAFRLEEKEGYFFQERGSPVFIGRVIGQTISTIKHPAYHGTKLMVVQPLRPDGRPDGESMLAVDTVGAGVGETVLVVREGKAAMDILKLTVSPIRSLIVGVVDTVTMARDRQT
jgi:ethanolamine utilization protein EutN